MSESLKIWLGLPPREVSPNVQVHWTRKARAVKAYREQAHLSALAAMGRGKVGFPWPGALLRAEFHFPTKRKRDKDNLAASLKSAIDGLADAGIVKDDNTIRIVSIEAFGPGETDRRIGPSASLRAGVEIRLARTGA